MYVYIYAHIDEYLVELVYIIYIYTFLLTNPSMLLCPILLGFAYIGSRLQGLGVKGFRVLFRVPVTQGFREGALGPRP